MKKILIIQTAFIGDVILATPLIEAVAKHSPTAQIDFLLRKGNEGLLKNHPLIHQTFVWNKKNKYRSLLHILSAIRKERYDVILNCQRFFSSGLLTVFGKAKTSIGFNKNPLSFLFSKKVIHEIGNGKHETERNLALLAALGWTHKMNNVPKLHPSQDDFEAIKVHQKNSPYVCIAPTSVWFTKQWPAAQWVKLIDSFPKNLRVYLLGGPTDAKACDAIQLAATHKNVEVLAGDLSFLASAALMQKAQMNYVNDSAPLHMASAIDAPVTAVFCSTVPSFGFGPLSSKAVIWETSKKLECRPCGLHGKKACPRGDFACSEIAFYQ